MKSFLRRIFEIPDGEYFSCSHYLVILVVLFLILPIMTLQAALLGLFDDC